jgi:hypothetical protein
MVDVNIERPINLRPFEQLNTYVEVAERLKDNQDNRLKIVTRNIAMQACGGLVKVPNEKDYLFITDGAREAIRPRAGQDDNGCLGISVDSYLKYEIGGSLVSHVEPWESDLLDRGLAWLEMSRSELSAPLFYVSVLPVGNKSTNEISERLEQAEVNATAMLDDFLAGVEHPRFSQTVSRISSL